MEPCREVPLSKDEEVGVPVDDNDICEEEIFSRSLAGKLWTDSPYNIRAFKSTIVQAWRLKNHVEVQELSKNLFLFRFATKKDAESVLKNGPWIFDRNILILDRVSGDEQPSELNMNRVSFWVRAYDLPLKMRSISMAKKLGDIVGIFEEADQKEAHRMGRFLRFKVSMDLKKPLMRATVIRYQERSTRIHFKYERLPIFCFASGRIGHQLKDCEDNGDKEDGGYEDVEETEMSFGPWLRASPLPKVSFEQKSEVSPGTCSKNLFASSSSSKCNASSSLKQTEEIVEQTPMPKGKNPDNDNLTLRELVKTSREIEKVAESLGTVAITIPFEVGTSGPVKAVSKTKKWTRQKGGRKVSGKSNMASKGSGKRQLMDVAAVDGVGEGNRGGDKKKKGDVVMLESVNNTDRVVLEDQHHLPQ